MADRIGRVFYACPRTAEQTAQPVTYAANKLASALSDTFDYLVGHRGVVGKLRREVDQPVNCKSEFAIF